MKIIEKSNTSHIHKTIFILGIGVAISYLINFFLTTYITDSIGMEAYGFVTISRTFIGYAGIITIALTSFIVRYITLAYLNRNFEEASSYFSSSIAVCICVCLLVSIVTGILIWNLEKVINIPSELVISVKILFCVVFVNFFVSTVSIPFTSAAYIKNRLDIVGLIRIFSYVVDAGIMLFLFLKFSSTVWFVGVGALSATIILLIGNYILTKVWTPELKFKSSLVSVKMIKNLASNGIWNSLNQLGNELNSGLDLLISNLLLSAVATGQISVAKSIGVIFSTLNVTIFQPFYPGLLKTYSEGNIEKFLHEIRKAMRICGFFSSIFLVGFITLGRVYMQLWLPNQDYEFLYILSVLNIGYNVTAGIMQPVYYVYMLTLKNKIPFILTIIGGLLNVSGMYILLKCSDLGAIAIVITTTIIMLCINLFFNPVYASRCLNIEPFFFYQVILKHILAEAVLVVAFKFLLDFILPTSWLELIISACIMAFVAIPIYFFLTGSKNEFKNTITKIKNNLH